MTPARKRARRALVILLPLFAGIGVLSWGVQTIGGKRMFHRIRAAATESDTVVLQRYYWAEREIVEASEMEAEAFLAWMNEGLVPSPAPLDISLCWTPHHRILLQSTKGNRSVEICFECDLFKFGSAQRKLPEPWRKAFRELFSQHGIPPKMPGDTEIEEALARSQK